MESLKFVNDPMNRKHYFVSPEWAFQRMKENSNHVVLDYPFDKSYDLPDNLKAQLTEEEKAVRKFSDKHIPGAFEIKDTDFESELNDFNIYTAEVIEDLFLNYGIDCTTKPFICSESLVGACRIAFIALWLGVEHIHIIDGGIKTWELAGLPLESGINIPNQKKDFGIQVPKHPHILLRTPDEVLDKQSNKENFVLASVRGWKEYSGEYSGYFYIDKVGEPYGATYAEASYNSTDVDGLINSKGELHNIQYFLKSWEEWGITPDKEVAFYCGSGWRAAVPFFITLSLGWENVSVYEGGWYLWDKYHNKNPEKYKIQVGNPREG